MPRRRIQKSRLAWRLMRSQISYSSLQRVLWIVGSAGGLASILTQFFSG